MPDLITCRYSIFLEDQFNLENAKFLGMLEVNVPKGTTKEELWDIAQAELFHTIYQWERAKTMPYVAPSTQINIYPISQRNLPVKINCTITKAAYSGAQKIRQETLATIQVYLTHPIASPETYFVLGEKLARMVEKTQPGLRCEGIALDYAFTNPLGDYGQETIVYSIH